MKLLSLISGILCLTTAFVGRIAISTSEFYHRRSIKLYKVDEDERQECIEKSNFYENVGYSLYKWTQAIAVAFYLSAFFYML